MKMIDRIIRAYQAKKLMLKAQEIQQGNIEEEKRTDLIKRIVKGYGSNHFAGFSFFIADAKVFKRVQSDTA